TEPERRHQSCVHDQSVSDQSVDAGFYTFLLTEYSDRYADTGGVGRVRHAAVYGCWLHWISGQWALQPSLGVEGQVRVQQLPGPGPLQPGPGPPHHAVWIRVPASEFLPGVSRTGELPVQWPAYRRRNRLQRGSPR